MDSTQKHSKRIELEFFIRKFIPKCWTCPIADVDFAPYISEKEFDEIIDGRIPDDKKYSKWYIRQAITAWMERNEKSV